LNRYTISFVGAGRLAGILCLELYNSGYRIDKIVSSSARTGHLLASDCGATWSEKPDFSESTDVIIVAVPDNRLKNVLHKIKCHPGTVVAHTAGSIGLEFFPERIYRQGVFYPLQTFSYHRKISFRDLSVFIEASDSETSEVLSDIARKIGSKICFSDTEHRRMLHLAAVFVCNFTNHMFTCGRELAMKAGYSFEELKPLIQETLLKALEAGPEMSQTGPAVRNDKITVKKHLDLLSFDRDLQKMYRDISRSIYKYYNESH
jgi:predicted short-subunit dehydrogenase-like oxidoreductase (DUF2520 family)